MTTETTSTACTDRDFNYRQVRLDCVKPLCREAIATMRRFLDDAEREVNRDSTTPEQAIGITTTKIAWGFANLSGELSFAMSALEDARRIAEVAPDGMR